MRKTTQGAATTWPNLKFRKDLSDWSKESAPARDIGLRTDELGEVIALEVPKWGRDGRWRAVGEVESVRPVSEWWLDHGGDRHQTELEEHTRIGNEDPLHEGGGRVESTPSGARRLRTSTSTKSTPSGRRTADSHAVAGRLRWTRKDSDPRTKSPRLSAPTSRRRRWRAVRCLLEIRVSGRAASSLTQAPALARATAASDERLRDSASATHQTAPRAREDLAPKE